MPLVEKTLNLGKRQNPAIYSHKVAGLPVEQRNTRVRSNYVERSLIAFEQQQRVKKNRKDYSSTNEFNGMPIGD